MKIAVLPDCHVPFHDQKAVDLAVKVIKDFKPDVLVHLGDLADFHSLSAHRKDPTKNTSFLTELEKVHKVMDQLDNLAPRKVFCEGNHCNRLQRYLFDRAPELYPFMTVESALQLKERGWEYHPYQEVVTIGPVSFVHDLGYSGVNGARQTAQAFPGNLVYGHSHRTSSFTMGNLKRDTYTCWNIGWLGDSRAIEYLPSVKIKQDWTKGFMLINVEGNEPYFNPIKISNGKAFYDGRVYS